MEGGEIKWVYTSESDAYLKPEIITIEDMICDFRGYDGLFILDDDLDSLECVYDEGYVPPYRKPQPKLQLPEGRRLEPLKSVGFRIHPRLEKMINILNELPQPGLITIARSQTPSLWTPPERVDKLEAETIRELQNLYGK